ncbi:protein of unknown function DUF418 [Cellulomonas flavigena DSM 20109]|uniref:DUF418 domain-containing protein n=1 Tax=Cellulomonas flavigena (strain ATCC 482 / DSM 20109 / BCRC 11376 / JCM 18109 / NBRC 3775 / NCIMB 8073 / NRS 134) TaxID=446466 RepID=D5UHZ5_CELFN|nr:DUF418 domain-containing protein [Cellulomonas flavigena]ADG73419.1 protein of unknown function DUF418 [Cellulomonas flavigena DSM 20109]
MTNLAVTSTVTPARARHAVLDEPRHAPTAAPARSLAPDLARGALLLFIALSNVWGYLHGRALSELGDRPLDASGLDRLVDGLTTLLVDDRSRPMFAILYGFGIATMATRLAARGRDERGVRRVLARRSVGLIVLGLVHALLLFPFDILTPYGVTGLLALALVNRSRAALLRWFWGSLALMLAVFLPVTYGWFAFGGEGDFSTDYLTSAVERVVNAAATGVLAGVVLLFVPQVVAGILLARSGWLTDPARYRARLGRTALVTGLVVLVAGVPHALTVAQVWEPGFHTGRTAMLVHEVAGLAGGFAYVCLFGWLAAVWADRRRGPAVHAVVAVGQRSLTSYLLQSVMFAPLLSAWGLGWGAHLGTAQAAALAVGVWLVTVAVAVALSRAGRTGPFEALLRRWTYARDPR